MKNPKVKSPPMPKEEVQANTCVETLSEEQIQLHLKNLRIEHAEKARAFEVELKRREKVAYDKEQARLDNLAKFVEEHALSLAEFVPDHDREAHDYDVKGTDDQLMWEGVNTNCTRCALLRAANGNGFVDHVLILSVEQRPERKE